MSKPERKTDLLEELSKQLSGLQEEKNKLEAEAYEWAEKRDRLNDGMKRLRADVQEFRVERDKLNSDVKELKLRRDSMRVGIREKLEEMRKIEGERRTLAKKRPTRSHEALQREVENIDWTIQTTPLTLEKDKELVERVRQLETQLVVHKKIEQMTERIGKLRTDIKAMRTENEVLHKNLMEKAQKSQETHRKMLERIEKSEALKVEADDMHRQFLLAKEKTRPVQLEISAVLDRIRQLKGEVREEEQREQKKSQDALRETLQKRAEDKLKRGEKLSWEEFQLLAEKGIIDHD